MVQVCCGFGDRYYLLEYLVCEGLDGCCDIARVGSAGSNPTYVYEIHTDIYFEVLMVYACLKCKK